MTKGIFVSRSSGKSHSWDKFVGMEARARAHKNREEALKKLQTKMQTRQPKPGRKIDLIAHEWDQTKELDEEVKKEQREINRLKLT